MRRVINTNFFLCTSVALGLLLLSTFSHGNEFYLISIGAGEESNLPRGIDSFHERDSSFVRASFVGGKRFQLGLNDSLTVSANAGYNRFDALPGFDRVELGVAANYRYRFGFGPYAPALNGALSYQLENSEGQARDTEAAKIEVSADKRFRTGFTLSAGIDYQRNFTDDLAPDPAVLAFGYDPSIRLPFELMEFESASAFVSADYEFLNLWQASLGYRRLNGFTLASTTEPSLDLYKISDAFYSDPAFGEESRLPWFGYLLETNSDQWDGRLSVPIFQDSSIDFTLSWTDIKGPDGRDYDNTIYAVTFIHAL
ncbi:MAG: hypothetical protein AB8B95_00525 [Pseudohongiellaceae bacterium]